MCLCQTRFSNLAGTTTIGYSAFTYDGVGRLTNLQHQNGSLVNIANYTNTYDLASKITSEVLNGGAPTTYQYDTTDQLTNDSVVTYSYDLNGNRTMTGYTTGLANELTSDGTWNYAYDSNGNLIQKTNISTGEVFAFGYDNRNRMTSATDTTTSGLQMQATYVYDAIAQRFEKDVEIGGTTTVTRFAYDNGQIWVDMNGSNALQTRYLRTDQLLELLARIMSSGSAAWMLVDRMGTSRNLVDNTGSVVDTITYDGFGNTITESSPVNGGAYKVWGYRWDAETGLYLADPSWRYFDPSIGRWRERDPISFLGGNPNLLQYCGNNPVNRIDSLGLSDVNLSDWLAEIGLTPDPIVFHERNDARQRLLDRITNNDLTFLNKKGVLERLDCDDLKELFSLLDRGLAYRVIAAKRHGGPDSAHIPPLRKELGILEALIKLYEDLDCDKVGMKRPLPESSDMKKAREWLNAKKADQSCPNFLPIPFIPMDPNIDPLEPGYLRRQIEGFFVPDLIKQSPQDYLPTPQVRGKHSNPLLSPIVVLVPPTVVVAAAPKATGSLFGRIMGTVTRRVFGLLGLMTELMEMPDGPAFRAAS